MNNIKIQKKIYKKDPKTVLSEIGFITVIVFYPLLLWVIFFFSINIKSIMFAFQKIDIYGNTSFYGVQNFIDFFMSFTMEGESSLLVTSLYNSFKWFFILVLIQTPLYIIFSYYIFLGFKGSKFFRTTAMLPTMISGFIYSMLFQKTINGSIVMVAKAFGYDGMNMFIDPNLALPLNIFYAVWAGMTTSLIIVPNAMKNATPEIIEASEIDGAGLYAKFWYIIIPAMMPVQITSWITGIAGMFSNSYNLTTFYQYSAPKEVYTLGYYFTVRVMTGSTQAEYPYMSAAGMCLTVFATIITLVSKHFLLKWQERFE